MAHIKFKWLTSNSNRSHQIQIAHIKFKLLTSNSNCSHQIQIAHIKFKLLTSNSNRSHQIQIAHIKFKSLTSNSNRSHQIQITHWSAAKSMNTILSFHLVFHFTAILCDRSCQCALSSSPIRNILRAKCIAVIVAPTLITENFAEPAK